MKIPIDRPSLRMLSQTAAILSSLYMLAHWKMASCTLNNLQGTCKWMSKWNIEWQWWNGPHSWWRARWEWGCFDWVTSRAPPALHWHASEGPNWLAGYRWKCNCFIKEIIFKYIINERYFFKSQIMVVSPTISKFIIGIEISLHYYSLVEEWQKSR